MAAASGWPPRAWSSCCSPFVLAPIIAVAQAVFVLGLAAGRTIRWEAQLRDARALSWAEAARGLWPQTTLGLGLGAAVWLLAAPRDPCVGRAVLRPAAAGGAVRRGDLPGMAGPVADRARASARSPKSSSRRRSCWPPAMRRAWHRLRYPSARAGRCPALPSRRRRPRRSTERSRRLAQADERPCRRRLALDLGPAQSAHRRPTPWHC